ncbi:MAG: hypothetical protein M3P95_00895 [Actinomycetota bacterium]|nr:hypothetical protein [Actinomycetota bacterium]
MRPDRAVAAFDSASAMLRALSAFLHGRDFPALGSAPPPLARAVLPAANYLPDRVRQEAYRWSGWSEAVPQGRVGDVDVDEIGQWMADAYPRRRYPAVFVGSSNGALVHLAAAVGAPWLPQTVLVPVRRSGVHPDDPRADIAAVRAPARALLDANPDVVLHHMHDANQDRLMVARMTYFRLKRRTLGPAYERFLTERLEPGGTVVVVECGLTWPTTTVQERHLFQHGAAGGLTPEEYARGGPRVAAFLERHRSPVRAWDPPAADGESPEAEWGFDPALLDDVRRVAARIGARVVRLRFDDPEQLSAAVAGMHRQWYADQGVPLDRLLVESFVLLEPWHVLRTRSVPLWTIFPVERSLDTVRGHLDAVPPYDEIRLALFSHGTDSAGLGTARQWQELLGRARKIGVFAGADPDRFPRDFGSLVRFGDALAAVRADYPMPDPLPLARAAELVAECGREHGVTWTAG